MEPTITASSEVSASSDNLTALLSKVVNELNQVCERLEHTSSNTNCQIFYGPISGSVFNMPGGQVENHPTQVVESSGNTKVIDDGPKAQDERLLVPIPDDLLPDILAAPEKTIRSATNNFVIKTIQKAGELCKEPWHFACLMAVCDDHGLLIDRTAVTNFARTMVAWGIVKLENERTIPQLANSMGYTMKLLPLRYKNWGAELKAQRDKCESLAACFDASIPYKY
ncbi:MAG: hypothetical protein Q4B58_07705 [Bacteroidales bacterium]|nr:hypothetical protein [Bacteroidales bacterium]